MNLACKRLKTFLKVMMLQVVKIAPIKDKGLFILHNHYLCWWWLRNARSKAISSHGIDQLLLQNSILSTMSVNTLRPRQYDRHCPDKTFECFFLNKDVSIVITISVKFVPKGPIDNIPALVQIMAWHCPGNKPLSELMMVSLPMHICVTRPQQVNTFRMKCLTVCWHFLH